METYRILISNFDESLQTFDISWMNRKFRWETEALEIPDALHIYLTALAENTRKPPSVCLTLSANHVWPEASVTIMTPEQVATADAAPE